MNIVQRRAVLVKWFFISHRIEITVSSLLIIQRFLSLWDHALLWFNLLLMIGPLYVHDWLLSRERTESSLNGLSSLGHLRVSDRVNILLLLVIGSHGVKLFPEADLVSFSSQIRVSDLSLKRVNLPLVIFFEVIGPLSLFFDDSFKSGSIRFKLRYMLLSGLEEGLHLNVIPFMLVQSCFQLIILSHHRSHV